MSNYDDHETAYDKLEWQKLEWQQRALKAEAMLLDTANTARDYHDIAADALCAGLVECEQLRERVAELTKLAPDPIRVVLGCPECGALHVDSGLWIKRKHKTHQCQACQHEWRPFPFATVGVAPKSDTRIAEDSYAIPVAQNMTRNPTLLEELQRVRSERNHYREKYFAGTTVLDTPPLDLSPALTIDAQRARDTWAAYVGCEEMLKASQKRERIIQDHRERACKDSVHWQERAFAAERALRGDRGYGGAFFRPEVLSFSSLMESVLRDHEVGDFVKPGWKDEYVEDLLNSLHEEFRELQVAVRSDQRLHERALASINPSKIEDERVKSKEKLAREAADVANYAMMVADVCGALILTAKPAKAEESSDVEVAQEIDDEDPR